MRLGNMRGRNTKAQRGAILLLATLLVGSGVVAAYEITDLNVIDQGYIFAVNLSEKDKLIYTNSTIVVKLNLTPELNTNDHVWIAVKPDKSIANWWPQSRGELNGKGEYEGNAFLGGDKGDVFTIGILILNDTLDRSFSEWGANSKIMNSWPPITEGDPKTKSKVSKKTIEDAALGYIRTRLIEEKKIQEDIILNI